MLPIRDKFGSRLFLVLTTLILLLATIAVGVGGEYLIRLRAQDNFRLQLVETAGNLQSRLDSYGQLILGIEAFITLNDNVTLSDLNAYTEGIRLKRDFQGVSSIGLVRGITKEELPQFRDSLTVEVAEFTTGRINTLPLMPTGNEILTEENSIDGKYYVVEYIGPATDDTLRISGLNTAQFADRRQAIIKALGSEKSVATDNLELATGLNGFILYKRIATQDGNAEDLIALSFRSNDFYRELLKDLLNTQDIRVSLKEADNSVLFEEGGIIDPYFKEDIILNFGGRQFVFTLEGDKNFRQISTSINLPLLLSAAVGITSTLILLFIINLNKTKEDTEKLAADSASKAERLEDQIQTILDNTSIMVYVKGNDGKYQLVNKEFSRLVGEQTINMIGKTDFDIFPASIAARIVENDRKVVSTKARQQFEEKIPNTNGTEEIYYSQKFPLLNAQNEVYAIGGVSTNVTEQKKNTEKLEERRAELERVNNMMIDRELKMIELKERIKQLEQTEGGEPDNEQT